MKYMRGCQRRWFSSEAQVKLRYPVSRRAIPKLDRHSQPAVTLYSSLTVFTVPGKDDRATGVLWRGG